jgi:maleylacetoacetate isomerase
MNLHRDDRSVSRAGHTTPRSGGYLHPMLRLYRAPFSTNVERVALALAHKGLEVESVVISYDDRSPVVEVSGQGLVPVLVDDDVVVPDSVAILRYLEEKLPDPPLFPPDAARRAELDVFLDWFNQVWKVAPNTIEDELEGDEPDHARVKEMAARMHDSLALFERLLDGRDHLFGDDLSAADCAAFPFLKYAKLRDPEDDELFHRILEDNLKLGGDYPRVSAWIDRVNERPRA